MKRLTPLALLLTLLVFTATSATAQTPAATVKDDSDTVVLQSFVDGGLLVPGTLGTGTIPSTGGGTRLMWYPAKAAFRVGRINGSQWDDGNVGDHSTAFGQDTKASGSNATAMGNNTTASGGASTAMGLSTTASNSRATAMGKSTTASGPQSTAMGTTTMASGGASTAMGRGTEASAKRATAMGQRTEASGEQSTAMGSETTASGPESTAMGSSTTASGNNSTTMGFSTTASGIASMAMGQSTTASGGASTAMGNNTTAASNNSLSLGQWNDANTNADNTLLVVGNGSGDDVRSDALVLKTSGNMTISGTLTETSDRRLKEQIQSLGDGALDKLREIRPVRFRFRNEWTHPSGEQVGLVAQDVRKEFPALVSEGSGGYLSVSYSKLTAVLLKGLQEQQATIDSLRGRVDQIDALTQRLSTLESEQRAGAAGWLGAPPFRSLALLLVGGLLGAAVLRVRRA